MTILTGGNMQIDGVLNYTGDLLFEHDLEKGEIYVWERVRVYSDKEVEIQSCCSSYVVPKNSKNQCICGKTLK